MWYIQIGKIMKKVKDIQYKPPYDQSNHHQITQPPPPPPPHAPHTHTPMSNRV